MDERRNNKVNRVRQFLFRALEAQKKNVHKKINETRMLCMIGKQQTTGRQQQHTTKITASASEEEEEEEEEA